MLVFILCETNLFMRALGYDRLWVNFTFGSHFQAPGGDSIKYLCTKGLFGYGVTWVQTERLILEKIQCYNRV